MSADISETLEEIQHWRPEAQQRLLQTIQSEGQQPWRPFYCLNVACNGQPHGYPVDARECPRVYGHEWDRDPDTNLAIISKGALRCLHCGVPGAPLDEWMWPHARTDQRPPRWSAPWLTLFLRSGRGAGKTRTGAEALNQVVKKVPRITLIGATGPDIRTTMVEGDSGILACAKPGERPVWEPSKKQLTWPNGAIGIGYSAEEPDRLRGQNSGFVWADEPAHWALVEACWENMLYGLRKGQYPKVFATSTPKSTKWVKAQVNDLLTIDRRVSSDVNLTNLSDMYQKSVIDPKRGSRMGRQEIDGEILDDVEGALWKWDDIISIPDDECPDLVTVVVAVDPAGTANERSDETGIIVMGLSSDKKLYILADKTGKYTPAGWAWAVLKAGIEFSADRIVCEKNYGGDLVTRNIEAEAKERRMDIFPTIKEVTSRRGKKIRAEPVAATYERRRVLHVGERGILSDLEVELTTWVPGEGSSPNRIDALVHGATNLLGGGGSYAIASPADL